MKSDCECNGPFQGEPHPPPANPPAPQAPAPTLCRPLSLEDEALHRAISRVRASEPHGNRMGAAQWVGALLG